MFSSLRTRLVAICALIMVLSMITVALSNFMTMRRHTLELLDTQTGQLLQAQSIAIGDWVRSKQAVVDSLKVSPLHRQSDPVTTITTLKAAERAGGFDLVFVGYPDKHAVFSQERKRASDYDPTQRGWYRQAQQSDGQVITKPYIGASSGKLLITFATLLNSKDGPVAGADVLLETVVNSVLAIRPTPYSYGFLVTGDGIIMAHPDKDMTLKPLSTINPALDTTQLTALAKAPTSSASPVTLAGREGRMYLRQVPGTDWLLAIVVDQAEATATLSNILTVSALSTLVISVLAAYLLYMLITKLLNRVERLRDSINAAGDGDFTRRVSAGGHDELTQIIDAFNRFADSITQVLHRIRLTSESVRVSSAEIASGNLDLSNRTEQQAHSLADTASSVDKLTQNVKHNADNAAEANTLAVTASTVAAKGGEMVADMVAMMDTMNTSSRRIFDIISVIDGIAFQTNILALNAAVEAARAGEQGRGFAVVASEVRSLAQRSATAAREIQALINDSVTRVESGTELVAKTGETMREIVASVQRVTAIMGEITLASQDQSEELVRINHAINVMDTSTQQNTALVEEAAAAAKSLQEEADGLAQVVGVFKLKG